MTQRRRKYTGKCITFYIYNDYVNSDNALLSLSSKDSVYIAQLKCIVLEKVLTPYNDEPAHLQNPPPHTNIVVTLIAFCYVWGCIIYYIQPN